MSLLADSSMHVREIFNVVNHQLATRPTSEPVAQSWARCVNEFQLDPSRFVTPPILTEYELSARREAMGDLIACSKLEMTTLYQQLADPELAVVLVDAGGVIVHQVSSVPFAEAVASDGFRVGALWSEREAGTNGMGTCLAERDCIAVCQHEHFYPRYTSLTCSAAPIFDDSGEIAGVLDVTSRSKLLQQHSLVLVGMSRQMIENRLIDARYRHANMIHFHSRPEFVGTLHGGKLAVADDSTVLAANRSALFQLGFRSLGELRGRRIEEAFNASLEDMIARSIRGSFHPVTVYSANATNRFFLIAQTAQNAAGRGARVAVAAPVPRTSTSTPEKRAPAARLDEIAHLEFGDPRMASQIQLGARVVQRKIPIILRGQTGTGKEVFAQALHSISPLSSGPFVPVNCASLPENLIESELFGYRAGAFTGAQREGRRGKIVQANGGTLFLDEIGDMPLALQARLLRVIEEHEVTPLGAETTVKVNFQLISASHRNLLELVHSGQFREDLYYRLKGVELNLPPLAERVDKLPLIHHLLEAETDGDPPELTKEAEQALLSYAWPGNIRQLRHVLQMAIALCDGQPIRCEDLPAEVTQRAPDLPPPAASQAVLQAAPHTAAPPAAHADDDADLSALNAIQLNERETVLTLLEENRWNVSNVAKALGISRNTLYRKMRRLHIRLSHDGSANDDAAADDAADDPAPHATAAEAFPTNASPHTHHA
ncbi:sigma-54-dependent Fis family transcriptional regulator [bacterium M00.F.Ca.ET.228.01.1.1]|uniref:sigma-54-dependent Fis family transcriptional regulator n=1 Tax=Paraburkholderia phenoliruptrix TaxID=252970 RepID=UPI001092D8B8|nr:sigma-54-dependent Fis family transcriptional regulator [Paraburkholderia phenoliruptrix]TGP47930.1 sigma-54-dependent Fis family transcriptional regulator [bacterium M00.F.Ca.ET.228.01.1.1]TGS05722.1 sigma-54-dependent Fis family transcriptional regulator [bacterium M00.F.Ca.ET.191.01.1.1]TGU10659.1 sigma-54-dependent Fis family transcriptional regulator [bacterium M00.F.Ca.ET.155.01.1.1]MBW0445261.1 sigma-54-dependent Fis family transcriptional regulator [Paraburkholderia phenoliruptrix]M